MEIPEVKLYAVKKISESYNFGLEESSTGILGIDQLLIHCTQVRFASFLSGGLITASALNTPERKLVKCTSVHCTCTNTHALES